MIRHSLLFGLLLLLLGGCGVFVPYDEALFRQGLDQLPASRTPEPFMELQRDYPASPWTRRSAAITALLEQSRRQQNSLRQLQDSGAACKAERDRLQEQLRRLRELTIEMELKGSRR